MLLRTALLACSLVLVGCTHESKPVLAPGEVVPLPPASGTPIGYLLDNAGQLALSDEQMTKLKQIDTSLSARNEGIDTQLREIEKPEEEAPPEKGAPPPRQNMAPGAGPMRTTADASKLHAARDANNKDALEKAFALLDAEQKVTARRLLADRGVSSPGGPDRPAPGADAAGGVPLEP